MGGEGPGGQAGRSCVRAAWPPWSDRQDGAVGAPGRGLKSVKAPRAPSDVSPPAPASDGRREAEGECLPGSSGEGEPQVQCLDLVSAAPAEHGPGVSLSDDHYISYCGQESLRRNVVAIMVNKRVLNAVLGCNLENDRGSLFISKANHSIPQESKPMYQPVMLKKLKLKGSMKTYKTF